MDGVLVNSVTYKHEQRTRVVREEFGLTDADVDQLIGLNTHDKYDLLVENEELSIRKDEFLDRFDRGIEQVYTDKVELLAEIENTLEWLDERGVKTALASASNRQRVEIVVDRFSLDEHLDTVVSADDISGDSKPDPAIYRHTAALLDVDPTDCVAVEDSTHGVTAATSAGMYCIGYAPECHPPQDLDHADEVVTTAPDLHERIRTRIEAGVPAEE